WCSDETRAGMNESGTQLLARLEARRCLKDIEPRLFSEDEGPQHGEVVELYGAEGTGKTELLYHLLCRCVLPEAAGGLEVDVLFVDTDYSLDMLRLVTLRSSLSRLLVVHCSSSSQLLLTLHYLETTLNSRPSLALLLIDSISAFYWLDRCEGGASISRQEEKLSKCAELLGRLLRDYKFTIFATCHTIRRSSSGSAASCSSTLEADRPYLCRPWQRLVTHRVLCSRQEAENHTAGGSREEKRRQVFRVHCSSSSSRTKASRISSFCATDAGVQFI
uniref:RecA family profile 1 domain-containing protein n=1 Tax=Oryzias melastigma TaxID=30732 RepID=A0A3B3CWK5_ORYME